MALRISRTCFLLVAVRQIQNCLFPLAALSSSLTGRKTDDAMYFLNFFGLLMLVQVDYLLYSNRLGLDREDLPL